jgi:methyl-accepting chemotaxis protein
VLANLRFRTKILMLPAVAGLAFVIAIITSILLGRANSDRLTEIERGHLPALQASLEIESSVQRAQRAFQDAVAAQDVGGLTRADEVRTAFLSRADELERARVPRSHDAAALRTLFDAYFWPARAVSHRLIGSPGSADVVDAVEKTQIELRKLQAAARDLVENERVDTTAAFASARQTGTTGKWASIAIAVAFLILLVLLSAWTLRGVLQTLAEASGFVSAAAAEILAVAKQTEANAADEAAFVDETRRAMQGLLESASAIAQSSKQVLDRAEQSADASRGIAGRISELNAQALKITDISDVIRSIADKSDILALNASLEGSRAGESGRGFALVGAEMRRLAETVMGAVRQIKQLANEIREVSQAAVLAAEDGQKLALDTTQTSKQITLITSQQSSATEQVTQSMNEIQQYSRQAIGGAQQARSAAADLVRTTTQLKSLIDGRSVEASA